MHETGRVRYTSNFVSSRPFQDAILSGKKAVERGGFTKESYSTIAIVEARDTLSRAMSVTKDVAQWALFEITPSRGDVVAMFGNDWSWNCIHGRGCRTVKAYDGHHSSIFLNFLRDSTLMVSPNSS